MIRIESGPALELHRSWFEQAAEVAQSSTCLKDHCGAVLVRQDQLVIGRGYNAPPLGEESNRTCLMQFDRTRKPQYDLTCCVHAEWAALDEAERLHQHSLPGSTMYFMRLDDQGAWTDAGQPRCTVCSRLTMMMRVERFALWNNGGVDLYPLPEYDRLSYAYHALP